MTVDETLNERGNAYGKYEMNLYSRAQIMEQLNEVHIEKNNHCMNARDYQAINDIVIKLVRLAATPEHLDSWLDIEGYARLNKERLS